MSFAEPLWMLCFLFFLPLLARHLRKEKRTAFKLPATTELQHARQRSWRLYLSRGLVILRYLSLACLVFALARPQFGHSEIKRRSEGLDIILAIDTSGSMRALDFKVGDETTNRLMAVKSVIEQFVRERPDDRIGMVVFGSEAFTQAPLTLDHEVLLQFLKTIRIGVAGDATAIGDAIATAANRLKDIEAKSRVAILLTDGRNTAGKIDPRLAAEAAHKVGVKVYTIGVGKDGKVPIPVDTPFGRRLSYQRQDLDESLLKKIAEVTGARYFRAYNTESLKEIYDTIDRLEKTKIETKEYHDYEDIFMIFLWPGLLSLIVEMLFGLTKIRRID